MYMSYFFTLIASIFASIILFNAFDNWEQNVPDCLSYFTYYLIRALMCFALLFTVGLLLIGWTIWWKEKEGFLKVLIVFSAINAVGTFLLPVKMSYMFVCSNWQLIIKHNSEIEKIDFIGTNEEALARLYEETEKVNKTYEHVKGTTSLESIETLYHSQDKKWLLGYRGELDTPTEHFTFTKKKGSLFFYKERFLVIFSDYLSNIF